MEFLTVQRDELLKLSLEIHDAVPLYFQIIGTIGIRVKQSGIVTFLVRVDRELRRNNCIEFLFFTNVSILFYERIVRTSMSIRSGVPKNKKRK